MSALKYKEIIKDINKCLKEIDELDEATKKEKTRTGLTKVERKLSSLAFDILVKINRKRNNEAKCEIIDELSDALDIAPLY